MKGKKAVIFVEAKNFESSGNFAVLSPEMQQGVGTRQYFRVSAKPEKGGNIWMTAEMR